MDWITGLDCWTGLLDWILNKDVRLACKTACVVKAYASQGHTDVAEMRNLGARFTIFEQGHKLRCKVDEVNSTKVNSTTLCIHE